MAAPTAAATPPVRCTTPLPAKSWNGVERVESHPPPQTQWTTIGYTRALMMAL